jgi:peptide-methionine (R)-S-oxide reductase
VSPVLRDEDDEPTVVRSDDEWRARLSNREFAVLRRGGTERPWSGAYVDTKVGGAYHCRGCGLEVFRSRTKFESTSGWASFYAPSSAANVHLRPDLSGRFPRIAVRCAACHGHLGHVYDDAPQTPTGDRYSINSAAVRFLPG